MECGENIGDTTLKQRKPETIEIDWEGTKRLRTEMKSANFIKLSINVAAKNVKALKERAEKKGLPYQTFLNTLLKQGLKKSDDTELRLKRLEKELSKVKQKLAA